VAVWLAEAVEGEDVGARELYAAVEDGDGEEVGEGDTECSAGAGTEAVVGAGEAIGDAVGEGEEEEEEAVGARSCINEMGA